MTTTSELYEIAEKKNIKIDAFHLKNTVSLSLIDEDNDCFIALNKDNTENELEHLAHEIGHCITGSFYNRFAAYDIRTKHEWRADKWAIKKLIPADELKYALSHGITEVWELAEYFNVSEDLIRKAYEYYKNNKFL